MRLPRRTERVRGLAALRDQQDERSLRRALAVAVLGRELRGRGYPRDLLDDVFADERRVVRGAARDELHARDALGQQAVHLEVREPAEEGLVDRLRRLVDLLQHEVLEAAFLRVLKRPRDSLWFSLHDVALGVLDRHPFRRDHDHLPVHHVRNAVRVPQEGGHVRGEEVLVWAEPDHERALVPRPDDLARFVRVDRQDGVRPADVAERLAGRGLEVAVVIGFDQVDEALRVRLTHERVASGLQLFPEARIILDDPVVGQGDLPGAVDVGIRVHLRRRPMGRPPRMRETRRALQRRELRLEVRDEAFVLHDLQGAPYDRDAGTVVPAVLEALQAVEQDREGIPAARIPHDPAHLQDHRSRGDRAAEPRTGFHAGPLIHDRPGRRVHAVRDLDVLANERADLRDGMPGAFDVYVAGSGGGQEARPRDDARSDHGLLDDARGTEDDIVHQDRIRDGRQGADANVLAQARRRQEDGIRTDLTSGADRQRALEVLARADHAAV